MHVKDDLVLLELNWLGSTMYRTLSPLNKSLQLNTNEWVALKSLFTYEADQLMVHILTDLTVMAGGVTEFSQIFLPKYILSLK